MEEQIATANMQNLEIINPVFGSNPLTEAPAGSELVKPAMSLTEAKAKELWVKYNELKGRIKIGNEQIKTELLKDEEYAEIDGEVKAKQKIRKNIREKVINESSILTNMVATVQGLKEELGVVNEALSGQLIQYEKETGQLSLFGGEVEFEKVVRFKRA